MIFLTSKTMKKSFIVGEYCVNYYSSWALPWTKEKCFVEHGFPHWHFLHIFKHYIAMDMVMFNVFIFQCSLVFDFVKKKCRVLNGLSTIIGH